MASPTTIYDTLILGAGTSGLACASRLLSHSRSANATTDRRILVLEARDRIGGRVANVEVNGCRLDTGANWIHGTGTKERPNPLMEILPDKRVRELGGSVAFRPPPPFPATSEGDEDGWEVVEVGRGETREAGDLVLPPQVGGVLMGTMWELFDALHEIAKATPSDAAKKTTMLHSIATSEVFRAAFDELPQEYHEMLRGMPQFIEVMEAAPLAAQSAENERGLPGMGLLEFEIDDFDGEQVFVQDGYTAVIESLARDVLDAGLVELGSEVQEILWNQTPVVVKLVDGRVFRAKDVVCTLPLGVLKAKQDTMFRPLLPSDKTEAVEKLGFGTLDKIFLVYERAWWREEPYASIVRKGLVRDSTDESGRRDPDIIMGFMRALAGIAVHPCGDGTAAGGDDGKDAISKDDPSEDSDDTTSSPGIRILSLANLDALTGFPALSCFVSCANALEIEVLPDRHAQRLLHDSLCSWFGLAVPKPVGVHVTRWHADRFSRGSYSHMTAGVSERKHRVAFQEAVEVKGEGRLGFAGEHTSRDHFATVHGALISGRREAERMIEQWSKEG